MRLCDVTLREATALSDRTYTVDQLVEAGQALDRLGVPLIRAGRPAVEDVERETVSRLASNLDADVTACCRARTDEVTAALETGAAVVEVSVPVSDARLEAVGTSREEVFDSAETAIRRVREGGADGHLVLQDAFRADVPAVAGAFGRFDCPVTLADTAGARTPPFIAGFLRTLADASADLTRAGVHFRDDLGCATANALVAAETGIDRVNASVAGVGERAGNAATEEVIVATETAGGDAGVATAETIPACNGVLRALGETVDERKAVLGEAARGDPSDHAAGEGDDPSAFRAFDSTTFGG